MTYKIDENPEHMQLEVVSYTMHKISKRIIKFELMKMQQIKKQSHAPLNLQPLK